jgi:hypothetical protein
LPWGFAASGLASNVIQETTSNGFIIGDDNKSNQNLTKFTWLAYGGGTNVRPVELTKFEIEAIDKESIQIKWETASEINSSYFEVQRGAKGNDFETINEVPAAGMSAGKVTYDVIDYEPLAGIKYYRLKAVDLDDSFEYSSIKTVSLNPINLSKISSYPNPAVDNIKLTFNSIVGEAYILKISDSRANNIYSANLMGFEGPNAVNFNISTYPAGIYYITILSTNSEKLQAVNFIKH